MTPQTKGSYFMHTQTDVFSYPYRLWKWWTTHKNEYASKRRRVCHATEKVDCGWLPLCICLSHYHRWQLYYIVRFGCAVGNGDDTRYTIHMHIQAEHDSAYTRMRTHYTQTIGAGKAMRLVRWLIRRNGWVLPRLLLHVICISYVLLCLYM